MRYDYKRDPTLIDCSTLDQSAGHTTNIRRKNTIFGNPIQIRRQDTHMTNHMTHTEPKCMPLRRHKATRLYINFEQWLARTTSHIQAITKTSLFHNLRPQTTR